MGRPVLVVGAGIAGLTLGIALRRRGVEVRVLERAASLGALGAGITVQSNAIRALRPLGLEERVVQEGRVAKSASLLLTDGREISRVDLGEVARRADAPVVAIHRARLQAILLEALGQSVELGREVASVRETADGATITLTSGEEIEGDFVIGADGIHSRIRRELFGEEPLRYAGYTAWRGVCGRGDLVSEGQTSETWGRGARFGIVPIGHGQVYWFAVLTTPAGGRDEPGRAKETLLRHFGDWHAPVRALIESTDEAAILRHDLFDRAPRATWSRGRITLIGDAAHPMTPNLGQGGCQAIEDAMVLAEELDKTKPEVLARYESRRLSRAYGFVKASRRMGALAQLENGVARTLRDWMMRLTPDSVATAQIARELSR